MILGLKWLKWLLWLFGEAARPVTDSIESSRYCGDHVIKTFCTHSGKIIQTMTMLAVMHHVKCTVSWSCGLTGLPPVMWITANYKSEIWCKKPVTWILRKSTLSPKMTTSLKQGPPSSYAIIGSAISGNGSRASDVTETGVNLKTVPPDSAMTLAASVVAAHEVTASPMAALVQPLSLFFSFYGYTRKEFGS